MNGIPIKEALDVKDLPHLLQRWSLRISCTVWTWRFSSDLLAKTRPQSEHRRHSFLEFCGSSKGRFNESLTDRTNEMRRRRLLTGLVGMTPPLVIRERGRLLEDFTACIAAVVVGLTVHQGMYPRRPVIFEPAWRGEDM